MPEPATATATACLDPLDRIGLLLDRAHALLEGLLSEGDCATEPRTQCWRCRRNAPEAAALLSEGRT